MKRQGKERATGEGPARPAGHGALRKRSSMVERRGPRRHGLLLLLMGIVVTAGCGAGPIVVDGEHAELWVYGEVLALDGTPLGEVTVQVEARRPETCETSSHVANFTITDAAGRYRTVVGQFGSRFDVCVHVRAIPPASSGLSTATASRASVEMRSVEPDSVRIDVRFSERS